MKASPEYHLGLFKNKGGAVEEEKRPTHIIENIQLLGSFEVLYPKQPEEHNTFHKISSLLSVNGARVPIFNNGKQFQN